MTHVMTKRFKNCRWCGKTYTAARPLYRDGFCNPGCKQAHYRAYKKYVTSGGSNTRPGAALQRTLK